MKYKYLVSLVALFWASALSAQDGFMPQFSIEKDLVTLQANGTFVTSGGNGSFSATSPGVVTVQGEDTIFLHPNAGKNVLLGGLLTDDDPNDFIEFIALVKRPASLALADLAGNWKLIQMEIGLTDGFLVAGVDTEILPIVIQSNGAFTVTDGTLNFEVFETNRLRVNAGEILEFDINEDKNFMLAINQETENGDTSFLIRILLREGNPGQIGDLSGAWRRLDYSVEGFMNRDYSYFSTPKDRLSVSSQGGFSGTLNSGSFTLGGGSSIGFNLNGESSRSLTINTDFMAGIFQTQDPVVQGLHLFTKEPSSLATSDLAGGWSLWNLGVRNFQDGDEITIETAYESMTPWQRYLAKVSKGIEVKHGLYEEFFDNSGNIHIRANYADDKLDGQYERYLEDSTLVERSQYANGKLNGQFERYLEDGTLVERIQYDQDIYHGLYETFFESGTPFEQINYTNGKKDGTFKRYSMDGDLTEDHVYAMDVPVSLKEMSYHSAGVLWTRQVRTYSDGILQMQTSSDYRTDGTLERESSRDHTQDPVIRAETEYHPDGTTPMWIIRYKGNQLHGNQEEYFTNGQNSMLTPYLNGRRHGIAKTWYSNGFIQSEENYFQGRRHGVERQYDINNRLTSESTLVYGVESMTFNQSFRETGVLQSQQRWTYNKNETIAWFAEFHENGNTNLIQTTVNDLAHGELLLFHSNGQLQEKTTYEKGINEGPYEEYFDNGQAKTLGAYKGDRMHGTWLTYDEQGNLLSEIVYNRGRLDGVNNLWKVVDNTRIPTEESLYSDNGLLSQTTYSYHSEFDNNMSIPTTDLTHKYFTDYSNNQTRNIQQTFHRSGTQLSHIEQLNWIYHGWVSNFFDWRELPYQQDGDNNPIEPTVHHPAFGKLKVVTYYEHGLKEGIHQTYDTNEWPIIMANYMQDQLHGDYEEYYREHNLMADGINASSPRLKVEATYQNGILHGEQRIYHPNGEVKEIINWNNGIKDGSYSSFRDDGTRIVEETYKDGLLDGVRKVYNQDDILTREENYNASILNGLVKDYNGDNGNKISEYTYSDGILEGSFSEYNHTSDGSKYREGNYSDGVLSGTLTVYDPSGTIRSTTPYRFGLKHGTARTYFEDGDISQSAPYTDGVLDGTVIEYSSTTGRVTRRTPYQDGLIHGTVRYYFTSGDLNHTSVYLSGRRHGDFRSYYDTSGKLRTVGQYSNNQACGTWTTYFYDSEGNLDDTDTQTYGSCGSLEPQMPSEVSSKITLKVKLVGAGGIPLSGGVNFTYDDEGQNINRPIGVPDSGTGSISFNLTESLSGELMVNLTGYKPQMRNVTLSPGTPLRTETFNLVSLDAPQISNGVSMFGDHFMSGIRFNNRYTLTIDWGETTPGGGYTLVNGVRIPNGGIYFDGNTGTADVDMGSLLFEPSANRGGNRVEFVAVSSEGVESEAYKVNPIIYPIPAWAAQLGLFNYEPNNGKPHYRMNTSWPKQPFKIGLFLEDMPAEVQLLWGLIPMVGGFDLGLGETQSNLDFSLDTFGRGKVGIKGGTSFTASNVSVKGEIEGRARLRFDYAANGGPFVDQGTLNTQLKLGVSREISPVKLLPSLKNAENTPFIGKAVKQFNNLAKFKGSVNNAVSLELPFNSKKTGNGSELVFDSASGSFENDVNVGLEIGVDIKDESVNYSEITGIKGFNFDLTASISTKIDWQLPPNPDFVKRTEARVKASLQMQVFNQDIPIDPYEPEPFVFTPQAGPQGWGGPDEDVPFRFQMQPMGTEFLQGANYNTMPRIARRGVTAGPTVLLQNIFPRSVTSLAQGGGRTAVVYTTLDPNDPVAQGTEVELLLDSGGGFQQMGRIADDNLGEFNPEARFLADGRLLAVWQRVSNSGLNGTDLAAFAGAMEIVWAVFDPQTSLWTTPAALTSNNHFDQLPRLVSTGTDVYCFWQSNAGNELIGDAQNPTHLHIAKWNGTGFDATATHPADFADAFEFDVSADPERVRVAYVQDGDADLGTPDDQEIYTVDYVLEDFNDPEAPPSWQDPFQLTINSVPDTRPRFATTSDTPQSGVWLSNALFWDRDGELVQLANEQTGTFMSVLNDSLFPNNAAFGVVASRDDLLLYWPDLNDGQPDIAARFLTGGSWSETLFLTQDAASENEVNILVQPNSRYGVLYNRNQANPMQTDLLWLEYSGDTDLAFGTPTMSFEVNEFDPNVLDVEVNLRNTGAEGVNLVDVSLYEGDPMGGGMLVETKQESLQGGEGKSVTFEYTIPGTVMQDTLYAVIDAGNAITETDENNNTASLQVLKPNLTINSVSWSVNENDEYTFNISIENNGPFETPIFKANMKIGDVQIRDADLPGLLPGDVYTFPLTVSASELFTSQDALISIRLDSNDAIDESDEFDNLFRLSIGGDAPVISDTDMDGMDDQFELDQFGDLSRNGTGDKDKDGASDLHEFMAGTNPNDPNSFLKVSVTVDNNGNPVITWEIQPGRTYRLESATTLGDPNAWAPLGADRPNSSETPAMEQVTDMTAPAPNIRFYRIQIVP